MILVVVALIGLGAVVWLMPRRPLAAIGVVFMLAAPSLLTADLPIGTMRLEQPALAGLIALTIWHRRALELPPIRPLLPIIAAGLVYLVTLAASSAFVALDPGASLRVTAWSALSMTGGFVTALLVAGRAARAMKSFTAPAAVIATLGLTLGVAYLLFHVGEPWIAGARTTMPRVSAFTLEPNLYASLLAAVIPLAIERWRARPSLGALVVAAVLLLAIGLGVTRGAYVGLVAGLVVLLGLNRLRAPKVAGLRAVAVLVIVAGGVGLLLPKLLLNPSISGVLANAPPASAPPTGPPAPPLIDLHTWEYRRDRILEGLQEWRTSPLIGLGAYSFGHTHFDGNGNPDSIASWPILVLHDAGLIGLGGFLALLGLLGLRLWRSAGDSARGPTVIAYAAAVTVLLVAYLATTALHFAVTWLILGGALGATINWPRADAAEQKTMAAGPAWRLTAPLTARWRGNRFAAFMRSMAPRDSDRLLDVGITPAEWRSSNFLEARYPWPRQITAVAPEPAPSFRAAYPDVRLIEADGRALPFADGEFDIGFSNAVIEHVGSREEQRRFVAEIVRTCRRVFLCTPNRGFPIDPHTLLPFVHWLPKRWWYAVLRWTGNNYYASEAMLNPLTERDLRGLFPPGVNVRIERQRMLGLTSILIAIVEPRA